MREVEGGMMRELDVLHERIETFYDLLEYGEGAMHVVKFGHHGGQPHNDRKCAR